jgi:hypothetical protein
MTTWRNQRQVGAMAGPLCPNARAGTRPQPSRPVWQDRLPKSGPAGCGGREALLDIATSGVWFCVNGHDECGGPVLPSDLAGSIAREGMNGASRDVFQASSRATF